MSNTKKHAERELNILAKTVKDAIVTPFAKEIIALADKFGKSGQSGGSAPMTAKAISQAVESVLLQKTICDITGIDDEWNDVSESMGKPCFQNNRLSSIFKEGVKGKPYYLNAIVFNGDITGTFTGNGSVTLKGGNTIKSRQYIKGFPFKPKTFYVDVIETEWADKEETEKKVGGGWWTSVVKDESQLKEVTEYYDFETIKQ